jgi:hypothetical protein
MFAYEACVVGGLLMVFFDDSFSRTVVREAYGFAPPPFPPLTWG